MNQKSDYVLLIRNRSLICGGGETMSTFFAYYIGRYFSLWLTPENEKSFESHTKVSQGTFSPPLNKKCPKGQFFQDAEALVLEPFTDKLCNVYF